MVKFLVNSKVKSNRELIAEYFRTVVATLENALLKTDLIEQAGAVIAHSLANSGTLHIFGTGHSHMLVEEAFYRAGGLVKIEPILNTGLMLHESAPKSTLFERLPGYAAILLADRGIKPGDVFLIASNSGRNAVPVEAAEIASEKGCQVIAITSLKHSRRVSSRAPSGRKLFEIANIVIDTTTPYGDASLNIPGLERPMGPVSTIAGIAILNSVLAVAANTLVQMGQPPEVYISANVEGE